MDKMKMHSMNKIDENVKKIATLFPECITEIINDEGKLEKVVDIDAFRQLFSKTAVEGTQERYQFTWPDKRKAKALVNQEVTSTLRPCREESVNFDTTENLYIEGDNLEVLKLLQETYLGKIKMIYIDPPYNTGHDFVYGDDFTQNADNYASNSGQYNEQGNRLVANTESNGRFHTDWLNMMYPRLKLARDLLTEDGAIFISIDDNEQQNIVNMCNELFGESNKVGDFVVIRAEGGGLAKQVVKGHDYLFVYAKNINMFCPLGRPKDIRGKIIQKNGVSYWVQEDWLRKEFGKYGNCHYEEILEYKGQEKLDEINKGLQEGKYVLIPKDNGMNIVGKLRRIDEDVSKFYSILKHLSADGYKDLKVLKLDSYFSYPKPISLVFELIRGITYSDKDAIIMDFFSGSATTAHAVMKLNAEKGGHRKFIMVQLPEECNENSEAYKAGYKNICEIGKERIRRAGKQILEEMKNKNGELFTEDVSLDIGFRDLKLDSSNMNDVYYIPEAIDKDMLDGLVSNIKEDRTAEDLLFQVMLDLGVILSANISEEEIAGKKVFNVDNNYLIACFDEDVNEDVIIEAAKKKPTYFVMRDSSLANDSVSVNFDQIFARYSPDTVRKVL